MAKRRKPVALKGCVRKRRRGWSGGWGRNVRKAKQLSKEIPADKAGVHAATATRPRAAEEPPRGSQSVHSSRSGVMPVEPRDAGRWMRERHDDGQLPGHSAGFG